MYGAACMSTALATFLERMITQRWDGNQRAAARAMGIPVQTLNDLIVNPGKVPNLPTLQKLAEGLGISIAQLVGLAGFGSGEDSAPEPPAFLQGLTPEDRAIVEGMTPEEFLSLLDAWRRLRGQ